MRGRKSRETPVELARMAGRFAQWRRTREFGARIPEALWVSAVALAGRHGLSQTATTLKLGYYALKKRVDEATGDDCSREPLPRPAFLELAASTLAGPAECVIEFEHPAGAKMRIHFKGGNVPDLAALGRSFWDAQ